MKSTSYKSPIIFYTLATLIPWAFWFLAGYVSHLTHQISLYVNLASVLGFIGLVAPMIIALILIQKDASLKTDFWNRFFNFNSSNRNYFLFAILIMPLSILLAQAISLLFGYDKGQFQITGHFTFSSGIFPVWFLLIIAPTIEELAWHSYGTDVLRNKFNLFKTSMIFGLFWGIWHIPLSSIKDYYQSNLIETSWIYSLNFLVSIFPFVILMNWLYYKTNRNILVAIIIHINAGFFNEIFATHPDSKIIQTGLLLIFSIIIILKEKTLFFKKQNVLVK